MYLRKILISILFIIISEESFAQLYTFDYNAELYTSVSTNDDLPFWLVNNKNGLFTNSRSDLLYLSVFTDYSKDKDYVGFRTLSREYIGFDYTLGIDAVFSYQNQHKAFIGQYYASVKYHKLELFAGAKNSPILYDGLSFVNNSLVMAGNARAYPKIELSSYGYMNVPFTNGYVSIKGCFSLGFMSDDRYIRNVRLHHKSGYVMFGRPKGLSLEIGFDHYAQWGGTLPTNPTKAWGFKDWHTVVLGIQEGDINDKLDPSLGNHLGQNEIKFNYNSDDLNVSFYLRNLWENEGQIFTKIFTSPSDIKDINYGLYVHTDKLWIFHSILIEYYSTMYQKRYKYVNNTEFDRNFNDETYASGWTNYKRGLGIPLNSPTVYYPDNKVRFNNTSFRAFNLGFNGELKGFSFKLKGTYHLNYGQVYNKRVKGEENLVIKYTIDSPEEMQYFIFELVSPKKLLPFDITASVAYDRGGKYDNNFGFMLKLSKTGIIY